MACVASEIRAEFRADAQRRDDSDAESTDERVLALNTMRCCVREE